jgi:class 3 adenylate cyclase
MTWDIDVSESSLTYPDSRTAFDGHGDPAALAHADARRIVCTLMFIDIVDSTSLALALGDDRWRALLLRYYAVVRRELMRFRGREIDTAGDGFFAVFDAPTPAIRCATRIVHLNQALGIDMRAGLHAGECEVIGEKLCGIGVYLGARIAALAGTGEVLVSSTVKELVAGACINFEDRGRRLLKGLPQEWTLFAVAP